MCAGCGGFSGACGPSRNIGSLGCFLKGTRPNFKAGGSASQAFWFPGGKKPFFSPLLMTSGRLRCRKMKLSGRQRFSFHCLLSYSLRGTAASPAKHSPWNGKHYPGHPLGMSFCFLRPLERRADVANLKFLQQKIIVGSGKLSVHRAGTLKIDANLWELLWVPGLCRISVPCPNTSFVMEYRCAQFYWYVQ